VRFFRTFVLFTCALGLLGLAGFVLTGSALAMPAALGGVSSLALAIAYA
jgi:hypothetical protein